uniref:Uncharacterized protein n=1 Tax=Arundo donax TaxID=35708 RepID=A0A0A9F5U3_ARUDO
MILLARVQALPTAMGIRVPSRQHQAVERIFNSRHGHPQQAHRVQSSTWLILEPRVTESRMILRLLKEHGLLPASRGRLQFSYHHN